MDVIVDLHSNADAVALADAKATGKYNLILDVIFFDRTFKQFYNICRPFEVAGRTHTNLNKQHDLTPLPILRLRRTRLLFRE